MFTSVKPVCQFHFAFDYLLCLETACFLSASGVRGFRQKKTKTVLRDKNQNNETHM